MRKEFEGNLKVSIVRTLMFEKNVSQKKLAEEVKISRQHLNLVLNKKADLRIGKCVKLAWALGVGEESILTEEGLQELEEYREEINHYYEVMMSQGM